MLPPILAKYEKDGRLRVVSNLLIVLFGRLVPNAGNLNG
jgi:hypothetical protein